MAKIIRSYRISPETDALLKAEAERLTKELGKKASEADVIEMAVAAWMADAYHKEVVEPMEKHKGRLRAELDAVGPPIEGGRGKASTERRSAHSFKGPLLKPKERDKR